jgi:hypothetical protein
MGLPLANLKAGQLQEAGGSRLVCMELGLANAWRRRAVGDHAHSGTPWSPALIDIHAHLVYQLLEEWGSSAAVQGPEDLLDQIALVVALSEYDDADGADVGSRRDAVHLPLPVGRPVPIRNTTTLDAVSLSEDDG